MARREADLLARVPLFAGLSKRHLKNVASIGQQQNYDENATIARDAWERGQELAVHGWVYGLHGGLLKDLNVTVSSAEEIGAVSEKATEALQN